MNKPRVVLESDGIYLEEPVRENIVKRTPIMTKEVYVEAFEKWILLAEREEQEHKNTPIIFPEPRHIRRG